MTLRLRKYGVATAYSTVGVGDVAPEIRISRQVARDFERELARRKGAQSGDAQANELWLQEVLFLLGQADVASIYKTTNFKRIFELRYPGAKSKATVVNWVFSVPFEGGRRDKRSHGAPFRFIIHLRLRRAVYAYPGIEAKIVEKLTTLLGPNAEAARVHAGLGWNDLMVEGHFSDRTFPELIDFIIGVHSLTVECGSERHRQSLPVLQRILTVFGYRETNPPDPPKFRSDRHLTFLRGAPGGYGDILALFGKGDRIDVLDGKADFIVTSGRSKSNWLREQRKLGEAPNKRLLRKVETHLMYFPARDIAKRQRRMDRVIDAGPEILHDEECGCDTAAEALIGEIEQTMVTLRGRRVLPTEQRYAIDNALFLLTGTLRDPSICCDVRDAVLACFSGLLQILHLLSLDTDDPEEQYRQVWTRLNDWHRFSEMLLRQRTVGSYDELLGQSDRSIVYSGGVQKFLYLADQLMKDFAGRIQPINPPSFATIYDSVKTIFSVVRTAPIVRMPTSQIFGFPLIVPDLWHEVAGRLFFLRVTGPFVERLRLKNYEDKQLEDYVENIADHYADIVVYLFGFNGDFAKFIVSLLHGWKLAYRGVPKSVKELSYAHLLSRAYLVYEFHRIRAARTRARKSRNLGALMAFVDPDIVDTLITDLRRHLHDRELKCDDRDWTRLHRNVTSEDFSAIHRQLYQEYVDTPVESVRTDLRPFEQGEIVDLQGADINALFGELAYRMARNHPDKTDFVATAALGESAALEYHRRQMTGNRSSGHGDGAA